MEESEETAVYYAYNPCYFLEKALKVIFKCLGFETEPQEDSSSSEQKDEKVDGTSTQHTSSTSEHVADTPSTTDPDPPPATTDPEADPPSSTETFELAASTTALRAPPRPSISTGSGPQIN